jgi:branched-chain amino acid transport system permease protein
MRFVVQIAPAVILFLVVTVSALPAIAQARMLMLGTAAFYTAGAFVSIYVSGQGRIPGTLSMVVGGLAGAVTGIFLAGICHRLRGDYFALATLCFAELLRLVLLINPPFPGPQGIAGIARGTLIGLPIDSGLAMTTATSILLVAVSVTTALLIRSPWGAALHAVHDHEIAARSTGLPVNTIRLGCLAYVGAWSGMAGALGVRYLSLADADNFSLSESIMVLVVVLLSGSPSVMRCLLFGAVLATLSELLRFVATGAIRQIVFGALLFFLALVVRDDLRSADTSEVRP